MAKFRNITGERAGAIYGLVPPGRWVPPDGTIVVAEEYADAYRGHDSWAEELDTAAPAPAAAPEHEEPTP